jgi:hypothetical protein
LALPPVRAFAAGVPAGHCGSAGVLIRRWDDVTSIAQQLGMREFQVGVFRRGGRPGTLRAANGADLEHLRQFISTRDGVEAYLEPRTTVTDTTIVLVARDGEWTRRRVAGPDAAVAFAKKQGIPLYEAAKVGYPQRMRDWTASRKAAGEATP